MKYFEITSGAAELPNDILDQLLQKFGTTYIRMKPAISKTIEANEKMLLQNLM